MYLRQSHLLKPGTPVWIWVVRLGRRRWRPGTVEALRTVDDQLRIAVKFERRRVSGRDKAPLRVGVTSTAMRYLELRDLNIKGIDRPRYAPVSLLERPEELETSDPQESACLTTEPTAVTGEIDDYRRRIRPFLKGIE